jgi:RND family efflux transporter MFP subunit
MYIEDQSDAPVTDVQKKPFSKFQRLAAFIVVTALAGVVLIGIVSRRSSVAALGESTERAAIPQVNVVPITGSKDQTELVLPGTTQSFNEVAICARTNGYLKRWYFDIGAKVRQGQLLAEIETPELDQQLEQARADVRTAQESLQLAQTTAARWQNLLKDDAVSKQETDQYVSDLQAKKSSLDSATSNVHRLEQLQSFEKVYAPFSGVITARNTDIGALIDSGSSGTPKELFHLAAVSKLRIFVSVPEYESAAARNGAEVELTLDEYPGKPFKGTIARNADSIDSTTRTLNVEIDVDNLSDEIKTGAYVQVHFKAPKSDGPQMDALVVPANALLFRSEGLRVAVVRNDHAELIPIKIGRDFGATLEVLSGLSPGDKVIANPSDSLVSGTKVQFVSADGGTAK